ncbi:type II toxin-antitoxin system HipA family toxin [Micromonospora echinofusca]|uniref:Type II toxin-antitoxin system HipA family toxin n=1 Tax=Micromonospora echinofusca TaxID=47858 RepID=A0ABS3VQB8_MICEH|nr:HipA domain-containing protein [Micromonospora echinofusca]MBO4206732.1 type II toxin-antitoxin system HipA family toxin [Micromonospora echinofusca]
MQTVEAEVRLHGSRVGFLRYDRGGSEFHYEDDLSAPGHRVLGQTFEDDPGSARRSKIGLPSWFANLLPEGALRQQIVHELGGGRIGDFTLLSRLGGYLPGAVAVHTTSEPDDDHGPEHIPVPDHPLRHSLAGVQLKYSVASERLSTAVTGDDGWWIVKLPDRTLQKLVTNEYLTMRWLAEAGFDVPPVKLLPAHAVDGIPDGLVDPSEPLYLIERFDRSAAGPIHVEDFAQVADVPPRFKYSDSGVTYDSLGRAVRQLTGEAGYTDYIRRLVAMLVTGNTDAHLKNWALRYQDGRTPALAPVYDFHCLTVYRPYRYSSLALSLNNEMYAGSIDLEDFRRLADTCGADAAATVDTVVRTVDDLRTAWHSLRDETASRFDALAVQYTERLANLSICTAA